MIIKHPDYQNGYCFLSTSKNYELQEILAGYGEDFKRVICNKRTARNFKVTGGNPDFPVKSPITINNNLNDGCFFVNSLT